MARSGDFDTSNKVGSVCSCSRGQNPGQSGNDLTLIRKMYSCLGLVSCKAQNSATARQDAPRISLMKHEFNKFV